MLRICLVKFVAEVETGSRLPSADAEYTLLTAGQLSCVGVGGVCWA